MSRVFYEVMATAHDPAVEAAWVQWMRDKHLSDMRAAGAVSARLIKLDSPGEYAAQYVFESRAAYDSYLCDQAPRLRAEGLSLFGVDAIVYSRRAGDILVD
ncbi:MAG: DUF4286 family protein [Planctomycetota bacterium]